MKDMSPAARALLQAGKAGSNPTDDDQRRVRSMLNRSVLEGAEPKYDGDRARESLPRKRRTGRWILVAAITGAISGAAAAVVVGVWSGGRADEAERESAGVEAVYDADRGAPEGSALRGREREREREREQEQEQEQEQELDQALEQESVQEERTESQRRSKSKRPRAGQAQDTKSMSDEIRRLQAVRSAVDGGRYNDALRLVSSYRKAYPKGAFAQEAGALRVLALCGAGRKNAAKEAKRYLARHPRSLTAKRIRKACLD